MMPTIRVDEDVWRFLQSKAKPFEDSPNDVLRRELKIEVRPAQGPSVAVPGSASPSSASIELLLSKVDYTYHRVSSFTLDGKSIQARTFKDLLMGVTASLRREHREGFDRIASRLRGTKRAYFSIDPANLRSPVKVPGSDLFVETNLNANLIVQICMTLVKELGHDLNRFEIH